MLPVGDRPLLERIIDQLRESGIHHVNLTTHYRSEDITAHFGDGSGFGVEIEYVSEEQPLGTAGALGLLDADEPILVMNGDILTRVDFRAMHRFHDEHAADMTVAVRPYEVYVPYGIVELEDEQVSEIAEKPLVRGFVNAGIYLINPDVRRLVPAGEPLEMPELIKRLVVDGRRVVGFPLREYWLDIGQIADYEQALLDVEGL
jgi:NDP-sugar pyrophosphorylase family protein